MNTFVSSLRHPVFGRGQIKLAAVVLMTLNHIAEIFLDRGSLLYNLLTGIGFFTAPVMCYFLVEGFRYTRNRKNYGLRLFLFALLSQLPFSLAFHDMIRTFSIPLYLNMICTLFICFLILCAMEYMLPGPVQMGAMILLVCLTSVMDWGYMAPFMVILFRKGEELPWMRPAGFAVGIIMLPLIHLMTPYGTVPGALCSMTGPLAAAVCILYFYSRTDSGGNSQNKKEKTSAFSRWFFYLYYPCHLLVLWAVHEFLYLPMVR